MNIGIMQPYLLPYIGYWQLIESVDQFVLYDNIEYTKKGWINRNRYLLNGKDRVFSLPLKSDSDYLYIKDRKISESFKRQNLLNQFANAYRKAPFFKQCFPVLESIILKGDDNLFLYLASSINLICTSLDIKTKIIVSSAINVDHEKLRSQDKVLAICKEMNASGYINAAGGIALYERSRFKHEGVELQFIKPKEIRYRQFDQEFVPNLSIIDVLMFNSKERVKGFLTEFELN